MGDAQVVYNPPTDSHGARGRSALAISTNHSAGQVKVMGLYDNQDRDDKQLSPWANRVMLVLFTLAIGGGIIWIVGGAWWHEYRMLTILHERGQRIEVQVRNIYQNKRYNRFSTDCEAIAGYEFTTSGGKITVANAIGLGSCNDSNPALDYAMIHHSIPLAYDPSDLSLTALNFGDSVFIQDPKDTMRHRMYAVEDVALSEIAIGGSAILALLLCRRRRVAK